MTRREFLELLAAAALAGMALDNDAALAAQARGEEGFYDVPPYGNVSLLHFTDCHAQLLPSYFREPDTNIGSGDASGKPPHLTGEALLKQFHIPRGTRLAHAYTHLDFVQAARTYGKVGGFAHLATLIKGLRAQRPGALLLDGGDSWQGSATALWTQAQDMVDACKLLGVDIMTGHWEFTYGAKRVKEIVEKDFAGTTEFLAQNVRTADFDDPVFRSYSLREINGVPVAIIGQAFPYTPIANPHHFIPDWTFGIQEARLQQNVDEVRGKGAQAVILLSHNGADVDLKLASRVSGIDVVLGGHTHDAIPAPILVSNKSGKTLVTNAGCNGKFLAVLDLDVRHGAVQDLRYRLLPVFSRLIAPDPAMSALIAKIRVPFERKLSEKLALTEGLLYRRGNFNGTFDQLILNALLEVKGAEIAFSPGFRWGTSVLPGQPIVLEDVMSQTAITYPQVTVTEVTGAAIKNLLEDIGDNLFNPDPYYQQGGDMVRVGGLKYTCTPAEKIGHRVSNMTLRGRPLNASQTYKLASWAPVGEGVAGEPMWDVLTNYLRSHKTIHPIHPDRPDRILD